MGGKLLHVKFKSFQSDLIGMVNDLHLSNETMYYMSQTLRGKIP